MWKGFWKSLRTSYPLAGLECSGEDRHPPPGSNRHFFKAIAEVILPTFGDCSDLRDALYRSGIGIDESFCGEEAGDFGDRDGVGVTSKQTEFVARSDFAFVRDREVKARARAREEALDHVVRPKAHAELVTGQARLGYDHFGGADGKAISQMD